LERVQASQAKTSEFCNLPVAYGVWPETAICLSHRSSSAIWLLNAVWLYATRWLYAMEAFEPRTYKKMVRWLLWLKTRHRTRLAVQQQRFATDSNAD
jgi:hypothetical protein